MRGATGRPLSPCADTLRFQSTRPMRGATVPVCDRRLCVVISIHAPHAGRDVLYTAHNAGTGHFNPRAPCGARPRRLIRPTPRPTFQSTRPVRGATIFSPASVLLALFQSTRPVRGATSKKPITELRCQISIHAPRAGRDCSDVARCSCQRDFNPRAPCGARPQGEQGIQGPEDFNPRAPCGARPAPTPLSSRS